MFCLTEGMRFWLWSQPTDMRKNFYSLAAIVNNMMGRDATNGDVYVFVNRQRNRIKLLHWEPGGLVLYSKLLESGTLKSPEGVGEDGSIEWHDLVMMVEGLVENRSSRRQRLLDLHNLRRQK